MARRRKIEISAKELECYEVLVSELRKHPAFADFDPNSLRLWAYEQYDPIIKDVDSAIRSLERYEAINRGKIEMYGDIQILSKSDIAKALGVSRPTVDKWISAGFLDGCAVQFSSSTEFYQLPLVYRKLLDYRGTVK